MSVRKRKWTTRSGEAKEAWIVDYTDQDGDRCIKTFTRKKEADAHAQQVGVDIRAGTHTSVSKSITVAQAAQDWIKSVALEKREASTLAQYRQHAHHIGERIGSLKLASLTTPRVNGFRDDLMATMSRAMARKVLSSLKSLLKDAQRRGNVAQNVALGVKRIDADKRAEGRLKVGVDIPSTDEIKALIAALPERWRPLLLTAIFTGLRSSELRGLCWADVDLKSGVLHVSQRADRHSTIGTPKSKAGDRTVPLAPLLLNTLRAWKLKCPKGELGLVFPTGSGAHPIAQQPRARVQGDGACGQADRRHWQAEIHRAARAAAFLCVVVHQSNRPWRAGTASEGGAAAAWAFVDCDDDGHLRPSVPVRQ